MLFYIPFCPLVSPSNKYCNKSRFASMLMASKWSFVLYSLLPHSFLIFSAKHISIKFSRCVLICYYSDKGPELWGEKRGKNENKSLAADV